MFNAKQLLDALTSATSQGTEATRTGASDVGQLARQIFGDAVGGVGDAAGTFDDATGASKRIDSTVRELTGGQGAADLLNSAKTWAGDNQVAAGAILGGLGALMLGTGAGRSIGVGAAKVGGLALIGGLAYRAYQRHQQGGAAGATGTGETAPDQLPAPSGTGFEPGALDDGDALLYVRAMIAGASADGHVDVAERAKITAGLRDAGVDSEAAAFLDEAFANPATPDELARSVSSEAQAARVYTAARMVMEPDSAAEISFLQTLAQDMSLPADLVASIDAQVRGVRMV